MDDPHPDPAAATPGAPVTEAELHAFADGQLALGRLGAVDAYLAAHPEQAERVADWRAQNERLRSALGRAVAATEPPPWRWRASAAPGRSWQAWAAAIAIAAVSAGLAWTVRGARDAEPMRIALAQPAADAARADGELVALAHRAAIAHAVYSPDQRRPVEVGAEQEQALVTWLGKRMGTPMKAPALAAVGYELIGGRLLPGGKGPVAQFMYGAPGGERLTLYVSREVSGNDTAFRFARDGAVNVFYWVEGPFGYAISAEAGRERLLEVATAVYAQLKPS